MTPSLEAPGHKRADHQRRILATLLPCVAGGLQYLFWDSIQPFAWFLFYPAVFFSAWIGGQLSGLVAGLLSMGLVWYVFLPPQLSFSLERPISAVSMVIFAGMSILFSIFHERLRKANQHLAEALEAAHSTNDTLEDRLLARSREIEKAYDKAQENRARLDAALASMTDGVFICDAAGRCLEFNEAFATIHRFRTKEECAKTLAENSGFLEVVLPDGNVAPFDQWAVARALRGETDTNAECTLRRKDTGETWVGSYSLAPIRNDDRKIIGAVVTGRDVTERRRLDQELQQRTSLLRIAGKLGRFGGWSVNLSQGRVVWSDEVAIIHDMAPGYSPSLTEGIGFYAPEWRDRISTVFGACAQAGVPYDEELEIITARGKRLWVRTIGEPMRDAAGSIYGVQGAFQDITYRKQAEAALQEAHARLAETVATTPEILCSMRLSPDASTCFTYGAGRIGERYGVSAERLAEDAMAFFGLAHPDDLGGLKAALAESARTLTLWRYEWRVRHAVHGELWVKVSARPVGEPGGSILWHGILTDITERKRAEGKLIESEGRYRALFENMISGFVLFEVVQDERGAPVDLIIIAANEGFEKASRLKLDEVIGKRLTQVLPGIETDAADWIATYGNVALTGESRQFEAASERLGVHFFITAYQAAAKQCAVTFEDVTHRKRVEAALQESEERFRTMANSMSQLAWIAKGDGFIFWYNQQWYDYTGTTPEEMEGWGWQKVHDPQELPRVMETWKQAIATGHPFAMEFPLRGADGKYRTFLTRGQPFKDGQGRVLQWFGTNTDVDELKQAEEKVRLLNAELEQRVVARTAELRAANEELEAFTYSVSHDLRAPLRHVHGYVEMLTREAGDRLSEKGRRFLKVIAAASDEMGVLIDDLLAFSRMGRTEIRETSVDLDALVVEARRGLQVTTTGRKINWKVSSLPVVQGDPAMLRQVFANLLGNAVKYSRPRDPAQIEVGCAGEEDGRIILFVRDNGVGFDPRFTSKLFGVFQRLHRADEFEGTGIGLANVRRIIARHGGRTWAEGVLNQGATFFFTLKQNH